MVLKLVGMNEAGGGLDEENLAPEEISELQKLSRDPTIVGLSVMTRDGAVLQADGIWNDVAPAIFSNVLRIAGRIGEEFGESQQSVVAFVENNEFEIAVLPLSKTDVVLVRRRAQTGGLANVR